MNADKPGTTVQQVKPEYMNLVAAIPHSATGAHHWDWDSKESVKAAVNRWTDWFTDELFGSEIEGVAVVKARLSRFECDVERLEGEEGRLCRFLRERSDEDTREWVLDNAMRRNRYLAEWFRYRAEILDAASDGTTLIIDGHSFPSDIAPDVDVCIGFNEDASKPEQRTIELVAQTFCDAGYSVALNHPYSNAIAPAGYIGHSLMIEVSKRTYMDEQTLQKNEGFDSMKTTIDSVYRELLWMRINKPNNFMSPRDYPFGGPKEDRDSAWEKIKESIVRFTAERYGVAMPEDISDTDKIRELRRKMEGMWSGPSWSRSGAWLMLANGMLREVFGRVGVTLPGDAFVQHYMHQVAMPKSWRDRFRGNCESVETEKERRKDNENQRMDGRRAQGGTCSQSAGVDQGGGCREGGRK